MTRALSIYLPNWPIRLARRRRSRHAARGSAHPAPPEANAWLLIAAVRGKQIVAAHCAQAEARGVRTGMSVAHARSLLRRLRVAVAPYTPEEDEKKLRALARWAFRFSPVVAPDPPDGLLIDIHGCAHIFGGEKPLVEKIAAALQQLGFPARIATAPTFSCARAVARFGPRAITLVPADHLRAAIKELPVVALRIDPATCTTLSEMGVERIGQLLDLPRKELAARFGEALLREIDKALGHAPESIQPIVIGTPLEVSHAFGGVVSDFESILAVIHHLLTDLLARLRQLQLGVRFLQLELHQVQINEHATTDATPPHHAAPSSLEPARARLVLTHPSHNLAHLWTLLRPRLEQINLGCGVEEIVLRAAQTGRVVAEQLTLWPDESLRESTLTSSAYGELLDQLVYRLGTKAVTQLEPVPTYVPERAFRRVAPHAVQSKEARPVHPAARPSRLFDMPEPLRVMALVPDGRPAWLQWKSEQHEIIAGTGPERIAPPWWENQPMPPRDYFTIQSEQGRWLWVFRDRQSGQWFVHGEWT